jgi:hypothetical protein
MFLYPLGLLTLLAVPAVVALHLFRRRFERRPVSALFLWRVDDRQPVAGRRRDPLVASASFWCELLAALALALAFAGPRAACAGGVAEHLVVVLDSSASMNVVVDQARVRDRAAQAVLQRVDALRRGSRVTLVASGPRPNLVAGPAAFPVEARKQLEAWQPGSAHHDLQPALALALELAGAGRVLLVTDHFEPELWPERVEVLSVGAPADNFGLAHAARSRETGPGGAPVDKVFLTVASFARAPRRLEVRATVGEQPLATKRLDIEAGARAHLAFEVPTTVGPVAITLPDDALANDNRALLAPPVARTLALASLLDESDERALGLCAGGERNIARWLSLVPMSTEAGGRDAAHLTLSRGAELGAANWDASFARQGSQRRDLIGPFLAERSHRLLDGVTLEGIVWSIDPEFALPGAPLVSAGNQPILTEERLGERVIWHFNLDPARSSLQRSPDWPILLANMAELRRAFLPGPERTNLVVGETFRYRPGSERATQVGDAVALYVLEGPLASTHNRQRDVPALEAVVVDGLEDPGFYRLSFAGRAVAEFALSFLDAAESDARGMLPGRREATLGNARVDAELSWIEFALIAAALALCGADWWVLQRAGRRIAMAL